MAGPITVAIIGDNRKLNSSIDQSTGKLSKFGGVAGKVGKAVAVGLAAGAAGAVVLGAKLIAAGERMGTSNARIEQVNRSMGLFGDSADKVSGRLIKLAESQARATGVDQNAIKATQAKLLTFGEIAKTADKVGGNFDRATKAAVDLAATGFGTAESNAAQLGKALNDPVKGLASLTKSGVTFTDAEKARISTLVDSNKAGKAQQLVLAAIEKQVGGTAEATANGTDRIKVGFSQVAEQLGGKLTPYVDKFASLLLDRGIPALQAMAPQAQALAGIVGGALKTGLQAVSNVISFAAPFIQVYGNYLRDLGTAVVQNVLPPLQTGAAYIVGTFGPILKEVGRIVVQNVLPAIQSFGRFITGTVVPILGKLVATVGQNLKPVFDQLAQTFRKDILPAVEKAAKKFREWQPQIQKVAGVLLKATAVIIGFAAKIVGTVLPAVIKIAGFIVSKMIPAIVNIVGGTAKAIGGLIAFGKKIGEIVGKVAEFAKAVGRKIGEVVGFVKSLPGKITGAIGNAGSMLLQIGKDIIGGLLGGIRSAASGIVSTIKTYILDKIPGPIRKFMGIASPSRVMKRIGKQIVDGLVVGIRGGKSGVKAAVKTITDTLASSYKKITGKDIKPAQLNKLTDGLDKEVGRLNKLAARYSTVGRKLAAARAKLQEVRDYAAGLRQTAIDYGSIANAGVVDENGATSASSITAGLTSRLAAIRAFTEKIAKLRDLGLNETSIGQIIAQGVEGGMSTAAGLITGGAAAVREVNTLEVQIAGAAAALGKTGASAMYAGGVDAAQQLVAGLETAQGKIENVAKRLAKRLNSALQRELKAAAKAAGKESKNDGNGAKAPRIKLSDTHTSNRTRLSDKAKASGGGSNSRAAVTVKLTAQQLSQLQRGKSIQLDLDAYHDAGGRK